MPTRKPPLAGRCSIAECIQYDDNLPCRVHLVPRPDSSLAPQVIDTITCCTRCIVHYMSHGWNQQVCCRLQFLSALQLRDCWLPALQVLETDPFFTFHHVNAFEQEGGKVKL